MVLLKCCVQCASKIGKLSSGHRTGKGQFNSGPKEKQSQRVFKLPHHWNISHTSKVMLKFLQARLQQYVNQELLEVQARFRKGRGTRGQIASIHWIIENARKFRKTSISASLTTPKPLTVWITTNCGKFLELGIPDHLTCLLRNLYAGQEARVRTGHGTKDWFPIAKGVCQVCMLSPCLFNLYAEYIMQNARLDEALAGIKIARGNSNNLRYTDDTILMVESEEELKSLLMKVKEESEKVGLNLKNQKMKIMASGLITSWKIDGETMETVTDYFLGLQNHCRW